MYPVHVTGKKENRVTKSTRVGGELADTTLQFIYTSSVERHFTGRKRAMAQFFLVGIPLHHQFSLMFRHCTRLPRTAHRHMLVHL